MNALLSFRFPRNPVRNLALLAACLCVPLEGLKAQTVPAQVRIFGDKNVPTIEIENTGQRDITQFDLTIGNTNKNFDDHNLSATFSGAPVGGGGAGGSAIRVIPSDGNRSNRLRISFTGFEPGEKVTFRFDIDDDSGDTGEEFDKVLFNNVYAACQQYIYILFYGYYCTSWGYYDPPNAVMTLTDEAGFTKSWTLPDTSIKSEYVFTAEEALFLKMISELENGTEEPSPEVYIDGGTLLTEADEVDWNSLPVNVRNETDPDARIYVIEANTLVEIKAPAEVFLREDGTAITSSDALDAQLVLDEAEERRVATGIIVNDVPQTGDPTLYRFRIEEETDLAVKWRQDFALRIAQDFEDTDSLLKDEAGNNFAGPLDSEASGNPDPTAKKHWVTSGTTVIAQVDGSVADYSRPGLDIRYVTEGASLTGAASFPQANSWFSFDDPNAARQQVDEFTMNGPGTITYEWKIQYGVKMNVDDATRTALPKLFEKLPGQSQFTEVGNLEGTFWFDPGSHILVACAANETLDPSSLALVGWFSGDGYYFSASGTLNTESGDLEDGGPLGESGSQWVEEVRDNNNRLYRGLEIANLQRPVRVLWSYGGQVIALTVPIGKHVFQESPDYADFFKTEPEVIEQLEVSGRNQNPPNGMTIWDPEASRLYPVVPGTTRSTWKRLPEDEIAYEVLVTAVFPEEPHYPHIAGAPPVSLDPDPSDDIQFKQLVYSENGASAEGSNAFEADQAGHSVLLFEQSQESGRGVARQFLRIRVVETKVWDDTDVFSADGTAIIGQKIEDTDRDLAELGTGYVLFDTARYNPNVYDASRLENLEARAVYDMDALRSTEAIKSVVAKENLPGPIIPVNLHPGAVSTERIVVAWYDDPAENDLLLWPHAVRMYTPRWPTSSAEGLGRIVIASQYGSESVDASGADQVVVPAIGNAGAEVSYNPSRLQQVQIYQQADPNLAGYNPNEEHALFAPSLRYAAVSPRPSAAYALRDNDLNRYTTGVMGEDGQPVDYTSHPFVLTQFFDTADNEFKMRVYEVDAEDRGITGYRFAEESLVTILNGADGVSTSARTLLSEPHVVMEAGEPVIPFYPLGPVIGAVPCAESFGTNIKIQETYWEDHKGTYWAVSGGDNAWFTASFYYPLQPDFWWPDAGSGAIRGGEGISVGVSSCVAFLPKDVSTLLAINPGGAVNTLVANANLPVPILYKSDWPAVAPILKAGETLTFSGGEYRADNPTSLTVADNGDIETVETPGLPAVLAFAAAEVVFDSLNPFADEAMWRDSWTARVGQVLEERTAPLSIGDFPVELTPATGNSRVVSGKYIFNDLPASLQKRFRYDPILGQVSISGIVNDKDIADDTLTAAPPAVYVLEPNILTPEDLVALVRLDEVGGSAWDAAVTALYHQSRNPSKIEDDDGVMQGPYLVGLEKKIIRNEDTGEPELEEVEPGTAIYQPQRFDNVPAPLRALGPGLALFPNAGFMDPNGMIGDTGEPYPEISWVTVAENNDSSLGGSPVTLHVIKVDRRERYRGSIKTVLSDNVFDENMTLKHTADFAANAGELYYEWWYRPDDGSLNVPPPDLVPASQTNPWKLYPDVTGNLGLGQNEILLKGNPNAPETLLADSFWFVRYRHRNDQVDGTDWNVSQPNGDETVNFTWAGAGNSDPFNDFDFDGFKDYRAQLASGWIKRVLDAVNPYEARIRDFSEDNPSTRSSMLAQLGPRFEGPVALNPAKNVIENVGLIELYETILKRGRDLSIDLSRPVSTPAIANALQLASTRISDFYMLLGNEAYTDAMDPTIGFGSDSVTYGSMAPTIHTFQNQMSSLLEEELGLLRGVDDYFARPVYNRLFWNFTKGEGEAAYALNYNVQDVNTDGFIDEDDAMIQYPMGHGDAWGHYLTALRNQYDLLNHPYFNWVSRSEFYNLMDIVIKVDFLDERKFAQAAAAKAQAGAQVVDMTYREKYVEDPTAQWQGYTDSNEDRSWGVQGWARRAGQGAYFDWVMANALLPSEHPNDTLEGIQKVDRRANSDIAVISANLNKVQSTFDDANDGKNPIGIFGDAVPFDLDPSQVGSGGTHFEQIFVRAVEALKNAEALWNYANQPRNMLRKISNSEESFRNKTFQEDLSYRNRLIKIFGRPYQGTIGSGKLYPPGYDGPDLGLYMYVNVNEISQDTVPGPTTSFAEFDASGTLVGGDFLGAWNGANGTSISGYPADVLSMLAPTFALDDEGNRSFLAEDGWYAVDYTSISDPKVDLEGFSQLMPVPAAGYTFQAPDFWGQRLAVGELQTLISKMIQQEAQIARAVGAWDGLTGEIIRQFRLVNAQNQIGTRIRERNEDLLLARNIVTTVLNGLELVKDLASITKETTIKIFRASSEAIPIGLPTGGLAVSPGDALSAARAGFRVAETTAYSVGTLIEAGFKVAKFAEETAFNWVEYDNTLKNNADESLLGKMERAKSIEDLVGDEPVLRIEIFRQIEALRSLSDQYVALLDEGNRLVDERIAFNKRVAAQTQRNRYQDLAFRVSRNHALESYHSMFELAARYAYLAAKAYEYETNFAPGDPASASGFLQDIVKARTIGNVVVRQPQMGAGGLADVLARMRANFDSIKTQLGFNNPQIETGKISLRTEQFRIFPKGQVQEPGFREPGASSDELWEQTLVNAWQEDLWQVPEFRRFCRPFAEAVDSEGNPMPQPGLVLRFGSDITAGKNFFGKPLAGGDHSYDPSNFATKIRSVGVWFDDYRSTNLVNDLADAPRIYLVPTGLDVMAVPNAAGPQHVRYWNVVDQKLPVPLPAQESELDQVDWAPLQDILNGQLGELRRFSSFRAYHNGGEGIDTGELVYDSRLIGRSVRNTQWVLIIPGITLNADSSEGLSRFIEQVSDIKLVFQTYGYSGN